jgi:hypothetical protein
MGSRIEDLIKTTKPNKVRTKSRERLENEESRLFILSRG